MSFNNLLNLFKQIEIELRSNSKLSESSYKQMIDLKEWDLIIIKNFINEVNLSIQNNDYNFLFKKYSNIINKNTSLNKTKNDLFIAALKRDQNDLILTDVINRLVIPQGITYKYFELWGMPVEKAREFALNQALQKQSKYLLFIDDDMIIENTALLKLWEHKDDSIVISADYQKKADHKVTAHGNLFDHEKYDYLKYTDLAAMGFTLINLHELTKKVPAPYFWVFLAPDGLWHMGEDAFFTKNLINYTNQYPLIDTRPSVLHFDKIWKKTFGKRDKNVTYASNIINTYNTFDYNRQPPEHPLINICIPKRVEEDPVATDFNRLLSLRGYKIEHSSIFGHNVDEARNLLSSNSVKIGSKYTFFVDNDIILPENALVRMTEILEENDEIGAVTGDYLFKGKLPHSVHLQLDDNGKVTELNRIKDLDEEVYSNWLIGMGCCLIRTEVFRQLQYPWFLCYSKKLRKTGVDVSEDGGENEDAHFSEMLMNNGYKIKILNDLKCVHVDFNNKIMYGYDDFNINKYACFDWAKHFKYKGI
jgi:hypothetical protein